MRCHSPKDFKIYNQLSSDVHMIVRGYSKDTDLTEDGEDLWNKCVDIKNVEDYSYHIQIKSKVNEDGSFYFIPTIWFENLHVELQSVLDIDIDDIENLAEDLLTTIMKHNFI